MGDLTSLTKFRKAKYSHPLYNKRQIKRNVPILDVKTGFTMTAVAECSLFNLSCTFLQAALVFRWLRCERAKLLLFLNEENTDLHIEHFNSLFAVLPMTVNTCHNGQKNYLGYLLKESLNDPYFTERIKKTVCIYFTLVWHNEKSSLTSWSSLWQTRCSRGLVWHSNI